MTESQRYNCFTRNGGNAIHKHASPEAKGSSPTAGLTLLLVRNPFRGNFNHWQVSRKGLPSVMKHYSPSGRRNHGRPLKRLLDTWDRNRSTSDPTPWQIYDEDHQSLIAYNINLQGLQIMYMVHITFSLLKLNNVRKCSILFLDKPPFRRQGILHNPHIS